MTRVIQWGIGQCVDDCEWEWSCFCYVCHGMCANAVTWQWIMELSLQRGSYLFVRVWNGDI